MGFCKDFAWGAATSAYQIEGAAYEDGKGPHIWDVFCCDNGRIACGESGDVACNHYHRFREDVAMMKEMGLKAYRFSLSWARILPDGTGAVNEAGIRFYQELIDALLDAGIEPYITLFHWDYPYALQQRGGWMNPESVEWFGNYARVVAEYFSDRVVNFFTLNEPQCFIGLSYQDGVHAPGVKAPVQDTFLMAHHVLMAHGRAVQMMRKYAKQEIRIGYAPTGSMSYPDSDRPEDIEAARTHLFAIPEQADRWTWNVSFWSDPVLFGTYPEEALERYGHLMPKFTQEEMRLIAQPIDIYGQNIYNGNRIRCGKDGKPEIVPRWQGFPKTALNWPVTPECLYWGPKFLYERYGKPIYITENGLSCHDAVSVDGRVHDPNRIDFLHRYLRCLKQSAEDGVDIRGYFQWSLMDNFEWHSGYAERFGLVFVDYQTQQRIWKDSAYWYRDLIRSNGDMID
ncbi:MAG: GH1 family beta-glucosidase [Eubacteriales bacterium]|nr:GH1 family beta-glucosidase [Eubacteriales bacterium]